MYTSNIFRAALAAVLMGLLAHAWAAPAEPGAAEAQAMLAGVQKDMIAALHDPATHRDQIAVEELVNRLLVPHVDVDRASVLVLGPHWRNATPDQRQRFVNEFRAFLVRFYSSALASYTQSNEVPDNVLTFDRPPALLDESHAIVHSVVHSRSGKTIPVDYRLYHQDDWKVVDVSVSGISMAQNYRTQFTTRLNQVGMDGLIAELAQRNSQQTAQ